MVDLVRKWDLCDGCELEESITTFDIPGDFEFMEEFDDFNVPGDFEFMEESDNFDVTNDMEFVENDSDFSKVVIGLDYEIPKEVKVVGSTECSVEEYKATYSIPTATDVEMKNIRKFSIPKDETSGTESKYNSSFSIPDYRSYKNAASNEGKSTNFAIFKDYETYKNRNKFCIPERFSAGWVFKRISIPATPTGFRNTTSKAYISEGLDQDKKQPHSFEIPGQYSEKSGWQKNRFNIPESGDLCNKTIKLPTCPKFTGTLKTGTFYSGQVRLDPELINSTTHC